MGPDRTGTGTVPYGTVQPHIVPYRTGRDFTGLFCEDGLGQEKQHGIFHPPLYQLGIMYVLIAPMTVLSVNV